MRVTDESFTGIRETQFALRERRNGHSWRRLADTLGVPHATLHAIAQGNINHVSWENLNRTRQALGLTFLPVPHTVPPCPDCGDVHTGRCHGKPVAAVVCLAPDETVRPVAKRRRSRATVGIGGLHPEVRAAHDARRNGKTWNQYLADMLQEPQP